MPIGHFITLEGGEGAGKSTQARLLADALIALGLPVLRTREPGGAPGAETLRTLLLGGSVDWSAPAETLLHFAARAEHVEKTIRPALAAGMWVVCDRFYDSTTAYQGYGRMLDLQMVQGIIDIAVGDTRPDLTLLFLVPQAVSEARRLIRQPSLPLTIKRDRIEEAGRSFFERVAKGYQAIAAAEPKRVRRFDATGEVPAIQAAIWKLVQPLLTRLERRKG